MRHARAGMECTRALGKCRTGGRGDAHVGEFRTSMCEITRARSRGSPTDAMARMGDSHFEMRNSPVAPFPDPMLSVTADYAIRALLLLARSIDGRPLRADEIADGVGAPRNYMAKTLNGLAKAGLLASARGPAGGFTLLTDPEKLTIAQVVDLFETPRGNPRCLLGARPCDPLHPCAAHGRWTAIADARRAPLATTTLADLLSSASFLVRLP